MRHEKGFALDLSQIGRCDTAGAYGLLKAASAAGQPPQFVTRPEVERLLELVDRAIKANGPMRTFLCQGPDEVTPLEDTVSGLRKLGMEGAAA